MSLDPKVIKESFALAVPIADQVAKKFYENLFRDYPAVVPLFDKTTPEKQRQKLISSLVYVVTHLEESEKLIPFLRKLGSRHTFYGTEEAHYDAVGGTLLKTFEQFLGDQFTSEVKNQWTIAFSVIKKEMLTGAEELRRKRAA